MAGFGATSEPLGEINGLAVSQNAVCSQVVDPTNVTKPGFNVLGCAPGEPH
jgi:hypothetical protein